MGSNKALRELIGMASKKKTATPYGEDVEDYLQAERDRIVRDAELRLRETIEHEVKEEMRKAAPTARDRRIAQDFVRDVEFDCLAYARTASNMADKLRRAREGRRSFSLGAIYLMVLSFLPTLYALHVERGWDHTSLGLWAVAIPWVTAIIAGIMHHNDRIEVLSNKESNLRGESTSYTSVADNAKKLRMNELQTETVSRQRLADIGQDILRQKTACDRGFNLSAVDLQEAKRQVREALIDDMDPEKLLRVDVGELPPEEDAEQDEERRSVG